MLWWMWLLIGLCSWCGALAVVWFVMLPLWLKRVRSSITRMEVQAAVESADFMASNRAMRDAGRHHVAREDGGAPARVHKAHARSWRW